jgi:hypothetical protein
MPSKDNDAPGMKGNRSRTKRGPLRKKRDDTRVRSDMELGTLLRREGMESLNDLLHDE